ncbi:hypothetical protein GCM10011380_03940 [Sphingomonas metalli]|uniref:Uncharacterized protein n=1 Tax=Sphingomonas metalli TaxID=1779358 RepID=A0A916SU09_9SPHN|nr:hypothetical protein [Sphingomonas metalli]GGB17631.1 hypothetical protein GCM10011380_03940 [Sphingomonas metalli]
MFASTKIIASVAVASLFAGTAMAAAPDTASAAASAPAATGKTSRADNPDQRYCVVNDVTGSRLAHRECRALSDWQAQGIDPRLLPRRR